MAAAAVAAAGSSSNSSRCICVNADVLAVPAIDAAVDVVVVAVAAVGALVAGAVAAAAAVAVAVVAAGAVAAAVDVAAAAANADRMCGPQHTSIHLSTASMCRFSIQPGISLPTCIDHNCGSSVMQLLLLLPPVRPAYIVTLHAWSFGFQQWPFGVQPVCVVQRGDAS